MKNDTTAFQWHLLITVGPPYLLVLYLWIQTYLKYFEKNILSVLNI
jgi:hypothetical protein